MNKKSPTNKNLKGILCSNSKMSKLSDSALDAITSAIVSSGITIPEEATGIESQLPNSVQLSKMDIVLLALISNPNKWFLAHSGTKPRSDIGIYSLGNCFRMVRKKENGKHNHYAMYNGGALNENGRRRIASLNRKMESLAKVASRNQSVKIVDVTPIPHSVNKKSGKASVKPLPKRARKITKSMSVDSAKTSITHAAKYPLTADEKKFLDFVTSPARIEYVLSEGTKENIWHSFRWKWQSRYGFDLSQISLRQEKMPNGTYKIFGTYTPNAANMMNPGLKSFVEFLETKGQKHNLNLTVVETVSE